MLNEPSLLGAPVGLVGLGLRSGVIDLAAEYVVVPVSVAGALKVGWTDRRRARPGTPAFSSSTPARRGAVSDI